MESTLKNLGLVGLNFHDSLPKALEENLPNEIVSLPKRGKKLLAKVSKQANAKTLKISDGQDAVAEREVAYKSLQDDMRSIHPLIEKQRLSETVNFAAIGQSTYHIQLENGARQDCRAVYELKDLWRAAKTESAGKPLTTHLKSTVERFPQRFEEVKLKLSAGEDEHADCARALHEEVELQKRELLQRRTILAKLSKERGQNHIQKKIKSKSYHRSLRRSEMRKEKKKLQEQINTDPEKMTALREQMDKTRMEERATQRHRYGKQHQIAKAMGLRHTPHYQNMLEDSLAVFHEKSKKTFLEEDMASSSSSSSSSECDTDEMDEEDDDVPLLKRRRIGLTEEDLSENETAVQRSKNKSQSSAPLKITSLPNTAPADDEVGEAIMSLTATIPENQAVKEFEREMAREKEEGVLKQIGGKEFKAGWNSWTGPGMEAVNRKRENRFRQRRMNIISLTNPVIAAGKLGYVRNVIPQKMKQKLVKRIPFPFNTVRQVNTVLAQPIMREFTTEISHRKKIAPKVQVRAGAIVKPLIVSKRK